MSQSNQASALSRALLEAALELGVQHIVLAPGSRSQALALEAARLEAAGRVQLHVRTDERSAGFLALGIGLGSGVPAAVITTSGSAVANLLPAVLEAHHAGVPMLLLTADRPAALRGTRSNQTTRQDLMLAPFVRELVDLPVPAEPSESDVLSGPGALSGSDALNRSVELLARLVRAAISGPGPVQLNLQFAPPLSGEVHSSSSAVRLGREAEGAHPADRAEAEPVQLQIGQRTLVVAGARAGAAAVSFAEAAGAPLIAEVVSGAHFGPQLVVAYRELLGIAEFIDSVERVVVFGTPTLSRQVPQLLARADVEVVVVDSPGADRYLPERPTGAPQLLHAPAVLALGQPSAELLEWGQVWVRASRKLLADARAASEADTRPSAVGNGVGSDGHVADFAAQREYVQHELSAIRAPLSRERLLEAVWQATWPHDRLVFGASRLVRVADAILPGKNVSISANRGLSGIDGTIATGMGIALAAATTQAGGVTRVLLGDLAALHDAGSLKLTPGESIPAMQVIVGNDRGGTIFDSLEVAQSAEPDAFSRVMRTPHRVYFAALAAAYGWEYRLADTVGALDQALTTVSTEPILIEVPLDANAH